jgi:hypothetical protein
MLKQATNAWNSSLRTPLQSDMVVDLSSDPTAMIDRNEAEDDMSIKD